MMQIYLIKYYLLFIIYYLLFIIYYLLFIYFNKNKYIFYKQIVYFLQYTKEINIFNNINNI